MILNYRMQKAQLAEYQLDNYTILDILMNTLSAAEKVVFGPYDGKKYAFYDEGNSSEWKNLPQLIKELQIQKECLQSMIKLYQKNSNREEFIFPINLKKEEIINDLIKLRNAAWQKYKDTKIANIFEDIIKIINLKQCGNYSIGDIFPKQNIEYKPNEEQIFNHAKTMLETKENIIRKDKEHEKNLMNNNGNIYYEAKLNQYKVKPRKDENGIFKDFYNL